MPLVLNTLREWKLVCPKSDLDLVVPTGNGTVRRHPNMAEQGFKETQRKAGLVTAEGRPLYGVQRDSSFRGAAVHRTGLRAQARAALPRNRWPDRSNVRVIELCPITTSVQGPPAGDRREQLAPARRQRSPLPGGKRAIVKCGERGGCSELPDSEWFCCATARLSCRAAGSWHWTELPVSAALAILQWARPLFLRRPEPNRRVILTVTG